MVLKYFFSFLLLSYTRNYEDACQAMERRHKKIYNVRVSLFWSSQEEMHEVINDAKQSPAPRLITDQSA
jgi:hypothetical protein